MEIFLQTGSLNEMLGPKTPTPNKIATLSKWYDRIKFSNTATPIGKYRKQQEKLLDDSKEFHYQNSPKNAEILLYKQLYNQTLRTQNNVRSPKTPTARNRESIKSKYQKYRINQFKSFEDYTDQSIKKREEVRNEFLMEKQHFILRSMRQELKSHQQYTQNKMSYADKCQNRLKNSMRHQEQVNPKFERILDIDSNIIPSKQAYHRSQELSFQRWMRKHRIWDNQDQRLIFRARQVFNMLNDQRMQYIKGASMLQKLTELSLAPDFSVIMNLFYQKFHTRKLERINFRFEDFLEFIRGDGKTDFVLFVLNQLAFKARMKRINLDTETYITVNEHHNIILNLWEGIRIQNQTTVTAREVCNLLLQLNIVKDQNQAQSYILRSIGQKHYLNFQNFFGLFMRSILKGLVFSLPQRVSKIGDSEISPNTQYTIFRNNLIKSGIRLSQVNQDEGFRFVKTLWNFRKFSKHNIDSDEAGLKKIMKQMKKPKTDEYNIEGNIPSQEVTKIRRVNQSLAEYQKFISIENTEY